MHKNDSRFGALKTNNNINFLGYEYKLAETAAALANRDTQKETGNGTELMTITALLLIFAESGHTPQHKI